MIEKPLLLQVIEGGKDIEPKLAGSGPKGPDWLRQLGYGAQFVCHPKTVKGIYLNKFTIAFVLDECLLLAEDMGIPMPKFSWVDSKIFSDNYKLVAVLPNSPTEGEDEENGRNLPRPADGEDNDGHERSR